MPCYAVDRTLHAWLQLAVEVAKQQGVHWRSVHLYYEAPRISLDDLTLLQNQALSRIQAIEDMISNLPNFDAFCYRP